MTGASHGPQPNRVGRGNVPNTASCEILPCLCEGDRFLGCEAQVN